ncbi:DinB family protein [Cohnella hashimotonis]|uniref:DinB family protein n=1 Tax=Cohnella hashimotonis TaxID=2826895 RepID=A0ABT6TU89_9BACL|nr:DinB family protein [Cohnella hashimotonis]MDI4650418.1 DinB family protein [Cohnella hashimotonis]
MRERPDSNEYTPYQGQYVSLVPDGDLIDILEAQKARTLRMIAGLTEEQADYRYAPGKWSLKQVFGHISDNERIQSYRLLRIARGDKTNLPGYEQDELVPNGPFESWSLSQLSEDYKTVREATLALLRGLRAEDWTRIGNANDNPVSVRALACINSGHELHHLRIIEEQYLR